MKIRAFIIVLMMAGAMISGTTLAQPAPNPAAEAQWQRFLANHPSVEAGMVNNPNYLAQHSGIATWLQQHPDVAAYARHQGQIGGWDKNNQWHDRNWWVRNDLNWVHEHHPDWARTHHPEWYEHN
jgi:hypothetical protein